MVCCEINNLKKRCEAYLGIEGDFSYDITLI